VEVRRDTPDPEWDTFLETVPDAHYQQSSMWAQVKAEAGWKAERLIVYRNGEVVGGCQLLIRRLPVGGAIAYGPRGPVTADRDERALDTMLGALKHLARQERVLLLKVQPPSDRQDMRTALECQGFVEGGLAIAPTATVRIDLRRSPEELLGAMRTNAQRNIRKAGRLGVVVREGSAADLPTFEKLAGDTGRRQGIPIFSLSYYERIWQSFAPQDKARLFIAEHEGEALASVFIIGFAGTAIYKYGGWSALKKNVPPNELLQWTAMNWARERGYRYYDFGDIWPEMAQAALSGDLSEIYGVTRFKLNFGGEVVLFPGAYDYGLLRRLTPLLERFDPIVNRIIGRSV